MLLVLCHFQTQSDFHRVALEVLDSNTLWLVDGQHRLAMTVAVDGRQGIVTVVILRRLMADGSKINLKEADGLAVSGGGPELPVKNKTALDDLEYISSCATLPSKVDA